MGTYEMEIENKSTENELVTYARTYAEVDLDAIRTNISNMKANIASQTGIIAVIKTDGYGHGAVPIAAALESMPEIYGFAVATVEEAHILRMSGVKKPVLILGYTFPYSYEMLAVEEISPAVFREDSIPGLVEAARKAGKPIRVHVKVDTGMNRIGITPDEKGIAFVKKLKACPELEIEGIFTHFAKADEANKDSAYEQLEIFQKFVCSVEEKLDIRIPVKHCSNSAGIIELRKANMDVVRAGISLYGLQPSEEVSKEKVALKPALSWYSQIVYAKTIHAGASVSYGGTFTAAKDTRVATIPVGYGDGYPRGLSGKGFVLIHGKKAPILGRICMDQFMVDITHIPEAVEGDRVVLLGYDGKLQISAEELGEISGRFNYELVCDIGKRVPRVYRRDRKVVAVKDYNTDYQ